MGKRHITVSNVAGINNKENPQAVIDAVAETELITTAIGPNILPFIAQLIAKGIEKRRESQNQTPLDIIACENMIGGSAFLWQEVQKYLSADGLALLKIILAFQMLLLTVLFQLRFMKIPSCCG